MIVLLSNIVRRCSLDETRIISVVNWYAQLGITHKNVVVVFLEKKIVDVILLTLHHELLNRAYVAALNRYVGKYSNGSAIQPLKLNNYYDSSFMSIVSVVRFDNTL